LGRLNEVIDLKIGVRPETILKHFHPQAPEIYNASADLKQVCDYVMDPKNQAHLLQIQIFKPVRVMLAALVEWDKIVSTFKGQKFGVEIKFDGERIQIHKKGNELKFFTRYELQILIASRLNLHNLEMLKILQTNTAIVMF
jgi:DNA ligase-4